MCGIVAIIGTTASRSDLFGRIIVQMSEPHQLRGPDGFDRFWTPDICVGYHRLAIMDRSANIRTTVGDWTVWLNGCIYNHAQLREQCRHEFKTTCDTETVAALFDRIGPERAIPRLNGMFAIVAHNTRTRETILARDRYGIKPLYWTKSKGEILVSSTISPLLRYPGAVTSLNLDVAASWLTYQNRLGTRTLFGGISEIPAASIITIDAKGSRKRLQYWRWNFVPDEAIQDPGEAAEELRRLLKQAVQRQLCGDRPVCQWLSGGLDSGAIAAQAPINSLTACFPGHDCDESYHAGVIARHLGRQYFPVNIDSTMYWGACWDAITALEDLGAGPCWSNWILYGQTAKLSTVVLQGTGADELLGGYPWRYCADNYTDRIRVRTPELSKQQASRSSQPSTRAERYEIDALYFLSAVLRVGDRLSSAHGLEERVTWLDDDMVNFCLSLPDSMRLSPDGVTGKILLRQAMTGTLPGEVVWAPKRGFTSPDADYWRRPEFIARFDALLEATPQVMALINRPAIHSAASRWSVLALIIWYRAFVLHEAKQEFLNFAPCLIL